MPSVGSDSILNYTTAIKLSALQPMMSQTAPTTITSQSNSSSSSSVASNLLFNYLPQYIHFPKLSPPSVGNLVVAGSSDDAVILHEDLNNFHDASSFDLFYDEDDVFGSPLPFDASENGLWNGRFVPPPPRPPYFMDETVLSDGLTTCDLCSWAMPTKSTFIFEGTIEKASELGWPLTLIIVSILSAILGAIVMITVVRCKRKKTSNNRNGKCSLKNLPPPSLPLQLPSPHHHHHHHHQHHILVQHALHNQVQAHAQLQQQNPVNTGSISSIANSTSTGTTNTTLSSLPANYQQPNSVGHQHHAAAVPKVHNNSSNQMKTIAGAMAQATTNSNVQWWSRNKRPSNNNHLRRSNIYTAHPADSIRGLPQPPATFVAMETVPAAAAAAAAAATTTANSHQQQNYNLSISHNQQNEHQEYNQPQSQDQLLPQQLQQPSHAAPARSEAATATATTTAAAAAMHQETCNWPNVTALVLPAS